MPATDRNRSPLDPVIDRADQAAANEPYGDAPVKIGVASGDWIVMSGDDTGTGDRGRWVASDTYVDLEHDWR